MIAIRKSLHNMESHTIGCGPVGAAQPDEVVRITWVDEDKAVNIGWVSKHFLGQFLNPTIIFSN